MADVDDSEPWKRDRIRSARAGTNPTVLAKLPQSYAVIGDTQFLPGYCVLLVDDPHVDRLTDLARPARREFLDSMDLLGQAAETACRASDPAYRRMNYEILGNTDAYLHAHLFPRYTWEAPERAGGPVWLYDPAELYSSDAALGRRHDGLRARIVAELEELGVIREPGRNVSARVFFETARLRARAFRDDDLGPFVAYRQDPAVERYQSWSDYTLAEGRSLVAEMQRSIPGVPGRWYQIALEQRETGELVGDLAVRVDGDDPRQAELGFTLAPAHQGRGYATEAVQALLEYVFDTFALHRVVAVTDARNQAAAAVLERAGMRREGHFVENVFFKGGWGSELAFAVLRREWPPTP